ncbi:MAG: ATP-binding cassette domain-containing protein, partial [Prevotella sp.]|nr:ATP-binding cassette domain-containing protein [Prevotella sp.]
NQILKNMSKGMRKKVEIAATLSHHPKLLILDEATSGLDPIVRNEILELFLNFTMDEDHTIILSTHITSDLEHIADQIIFINEGKIILQDTKDEILDNYGILKCDIEKFNNIDKEDIIAVRKNKYNYDILINNKKKMKKKYKEYIMDNITLEDLMLLMIKGGK